MTIAETNDAFLKKLDVPESRKLLSDAALSYIRNRLLENEPVRRNRSLVFSEIFVEPEHHE